MTALGTRRVGVAVGAISGKRLRSIEVLKTDGLSNRAIAQRLGVTENAIRKLVGASQPAASAQFALAGITSAAAAAIGDWRAVCNIDRRMMWIAPRLREMSAPASPIRSPRLRMMVSRCR